jgi:nicotinamide-nucleotide amidase
MQQYPQATIITIGDELLIGQVIDTNSAWMAQELNKAGIAVKKRVAVGDTWEDIWQALDNAFKESQIVLLTGGLGPTADDITKPLLCKYFQGQMIVNEEALENVKAIFTRLNRPLIERNLKQAEVPSTCTVIANKRGTAPGMWFSTTKNNREVVCISMPGVPHEMKGMMTDDVIPGLQNRFQFPHIAHRTLLTAGVGESFLAEMIADFENALPSYIKLAYLPNYGMVRLRLSATGSNAEEVTATINNHFNQLQTLVAPHLVTNKDATLTEVVAEILLQNSKTIGTAESCTGGYIASQFTAKAGSSAYFKGSVVAYSNEVKNTILDVPQTMLDTHGAVSEEVVKLMAQNALIRLNTDFSIAVSGIMGPGGGSEQKPVGTVWMAAASDREVITQKMLFRFDRQRNIELTSTYSLNLLRQLLLKENKS